MVGLVEIVRQAEALRQIVIEGFIIGKLKIRAFREVNHQVIILFAADRNGCARIVRRIILAVDKQLDTGTERFDISDKATVGKFHLYARAVFEIEIHHFNRAVAFRSEFFSRHVQSQFIIGCRTDGLNINHGFADAQRGKQFRKCYGLSRGSRVGKNIIHKLAQGSHNCHLFLIR